MSVDGSDWRRVLDFGAEERPSLIQLAARVQGLINTTADADADARLSVLSAHKAAKKELGL